MKNKKGFTLIELLVVIAIIGILASLILVALSSSRKKARDAQRKSDITSIAKALEMYYTDKEEYPKFLTDTSYMDWTSKTWLYLNTQLEPTYIRKIPVDPINNSSSGYQYIYETNSSAGISLGTKYSIYAQTLENKNDPQRCFKRVFTIYVSGNETTCILRAYPNSFGINNSQGK